VGGRWMEERAVFGGKPKTHTSIRNANSLNQTFSRRGEVQTTKNSIPDVKTAPYRLVRPIMTTQRKRLQMAQQSVKNEGEGKCSAERLI